jgi:hypothetical protein
MMQATLYMPPYAQHNLVNDFAAAAVTQSILQGWMWAELRT